jgi:hypothetical protein
MLVMLVVACFGAKSPSPAGELQTCPVTHPNRDCQQKDAYSSCKCNGAGQLVELIFDYDEDGVVNQRRRFEYDGNVLIAEWSDGQTAGKTAMPDGRWDRIEHYTATAAGRTGVAYDLNGNGKTDKTCTYDPPCQVDPAGGNCKNPVCD